MSVLEVDRRDRVQVLRLNRPECHNALNDELGWSIVNELRHAQTDPDISVIAVIGNGSSFCAGLDLKAKRDLATHSGMSADDLAMDDLRWVARFLLTIREECDKPVIAAINGPAVGAGLALAMACDIRMMASTATLFTGYAAIACAPDGGLSYTLAQAVGYEAAFRLLLDTEPLTALRAKDLGLVGEVVDTEVLSEHLLSYCDSLASLSPLTLRLTKRTLRNATRHRDLEGHLRYELANFLRAFESPASQSARAAWRAKSVTKEEPAG